LSVITQYQWVVAGQERAVMYSPVPRAVCWNIC